MRIDDKWCEEARAQLPDGNYLIASLDRTYTEDECRQFDFIVSATTGTDHIQNGDVPLLCLKGADILPDIYATAEHTFALILSLIRKVPFAFDSVKRGNWDREAWQGTELRGKTLGIVGMGRVGRQVAKIADAFGMGVIGIEQLDTAGASTEELKKDIVPHLTYLLKNSDIITVHVPLTDETRGMFGVEQFKQMKPTAYFINTSRGAVVDEVELCAALTVGYLAGAAIDVVADEQGWNEYSFLGKYAREHNNLIISPHISGNTAESRRKTQLYMARAILDFIQRSD